MKSLIYRSFDFSDSLTVSIMIMSLAYVTMVKYMENCAYIIGVFTGIIFMIHAANIFPVNIILTYQFRCQPGV